MKTDKIRPPSARQLRMLNELGYAGSMPATIHEASRILNELLVQAGRGR